MVDTTVNPYESPKMLTACAPSPPPQVKPWPATVIWLVGLFVPGLPSLLMRRSVAGFVRFAFLILLVPFAFAFFGPFWDLVLFAGTRYGEFGLYPFLATCCVVPFLSVWLGFRDRRRLRDAVTNPLDQIG
jgi:hypothetical protein